MSNSSSNQSSLGNNNENIPLQFETLLNNPNEWNNNPIETTRLCFKHLYTIILQNQKKIEKIERTKATKSELSSSLNIKANIADIMRTFNEIAQNIEQRPTKDDVQLLLDEKANRNDLNNIVMTRPSLDDIKSILANGDIKINLKYSLDDLNLKFVSMQTFNEQMNNKANKDNVIAALHKKANKNDIQDIQNQINNINHNEINKKIAEIDNDLDRLIENIGKQFASVNTVLNNLTSNKADYKEIEGIITNANNDNKNLISKINKIDNESNQLKNELGLLKNNLNSFNSSIKLLDDKIKTFSSTNTNANVNDNMNSVFNDKINKLNDQILELNNTINNKTLSHKDLEIIHKKINDISNNTLSASKAENYCSFNDLDNLYKSIKTEMKNKIDEIKIYTQEYIKSFDNDIQISLDKKANLSEITPLINNKADIREISLILDSKLDKNDIEKIQLSFDKVSKDYLNKIDYDKFNSFVNDTQFQIESLKNDLMLKANIKEIITYLKGKANIDDVNKALIEIHNELDLKPTINEFNNAMDNQNGINNVLIKENYIGKWFWLSGEKKNNSFIPWEIQIMNTSPENFIWEKNSINIKIMEKGIYLISLSFFVKEKPEIQILINGEVVINQIQGGHFLIKNENNLIENDINNLNLDDNKMNINSIKENCIPGITLNNFLSLDDKSRISITYNGNNNVKGFLSLKKVC